MRIYFSNQNFILLLLLFALFQFPAFTHAQLSWLDQNFGNEGIVTTSLSESGYDDWATASAMQADSKVIIAGYSLRPLGNNNFNDDVSLFRFNSDGTADNTFGNQGKILIDLSNNSDDFTTCMALQSDGKILIGGHLNLDNQPQQVFIVRLTSDGEADQTFADNGYFISDPTTYQDKIQSIAVTSDGKILAVNAPSYSPSHFQLLRLLSDGNLDGNFGNSGTIDLNIPFFGDHVSMMLDNSQRILLADQDSASNFSAARCLSDGTIDSTFGTNGFVEVAVDSFYQDVYAFTLAPDGKILLAGSVNGPDFSNTDQRIALVRLLDDGTTDATFGNGGVVITEFENFRANATSVLELPDGELLAGGSWNNAQASDGGYHVVRYHPDGIVDSTFGINGYIQTHDGSTLRTFNGIHLSNSDNFIFAGDMPHGISANDYMVAKFNSTGVYVHAFGCNGVAWGNVISEASSEQANAITIKNDGEIVTASAIKNSIASDFLITVHNANGSVVASFGDSGMVRIAFGDGNFSATCIAANDDGSIIAAGYGDTLSGLVKVASNGNCDWTFGDNALEEVNFGFDHSQIEQIVLQSDGSIAGVGNVRNSSDNYSLLVFRLLSDGNGDDSFADHGVFTYNMNPGDAVETLTDVKLLSNGSVIAAGNVFAGQSDVKVLLKLTPSGVLDNSFGTEGIESYSTQSVNGRNRLAIQTDGKIVTTNETEVNDVAGDFEIHRFNSDGSVDTSFGTNGISIQGHPDVAETYPDISLLSDGRIAITGYYNSAGSNDFVLLLLHLNGDVDSSFGEGGYASVPMANNAIYNNALAVQSDDKVLVAGYVDDGSQLDQVIARFEPSATTAVTDVVAVQSAMQIYPNPVNDVVNVFINSPVSSISSLRFENATGQSLKTFSVSGNGSLVIKRGSLPSGIYFLQLMNDDEVIATQKVILR